MIIVICTKTTQQHNNVESSSNNNEKYFDKSKYVYHLDLCIASAKQIHAGEDCN